MTGEGALGAVLEMLQAAYGEVVLDPRDPLLELCEFLLKVILPSYYGSSPSFSSNSECSEDLHLLRYCSPDRMFSLHLSLQHYRGADLLCPACRPPEFSEGSQNVQKTSNSSVRRVDYFLYICSHS